MRTVLVFLILALSLSFSSNAQDNQEIAEKAKTWQQKMSQARNHRMNIQDNNKLSNDIPQYRLPYYHNRWNRPAMPMSPAGYFPVIQWYPTGTWMNVGPVFVSPDRRYVRFGINAGFSRYDGFETYQMKR